MKIKKKWGYIDREGKFVIKPRFDDANNFSEGLAAVQLGCYYGFIDTHGKLVIPATFETAWKFSNGLAPISVKEISSPGLRHKLNGKWIQSCGFRMGSIQPQGYIDKTGKIVIEPKFGRAFLFSDGIAQVSFGEPPDVIGAIGRRGYIDKTGKYIWEPTQ